MISKLNFTLTQLEYVLAAHKLGHFAKAAEHCHVTQPTLSMQIQKLEESLGIVIFDRSKKPILLTDVGKAVIEQIQKVVSEAKTIEAIIESKNRVGIKGVLVLGVIPTIAPYLLPRLFPVVESQYPDLELQIRELQTEQIIKSLHTDEIDVGLLAIPTGDSKLMEMPIYYEPFSVLCAKEHALSAHKRVRHNHLAGEDIWLLQEGHCLRHQVLDVCNLKKNKSSKTQFQFESGSLETLKKLINSYGGYTLLPWLAREDIGKNSTLVEFERPIPSREVGLSYRREYYKIELIKALHGTIVSAVPEEIRKIKKKDLDVLPI